MESAQSFHRISPTMRIWFKASLVSISEIYDDLTILSLNCFYFGFHNSFPLNSHCATINNSRPISHPVPNPDALQHDLINCEQSEIPTNTINRFWQRLHILELPAILA